MPKNPNAHLPHQRRAVEADGTVHAARFAPGGFTTACAVYPAPQAVELDAAPTRAIACAGCLDVTAGNEDHMTDLDLWQQPNGFPRADYFETVHDALTTIGITPESWHQGDPWEGAVVLGEDVLTGTLYARDDQVTVAWRVDQDCDPKHAEDFEGDGWYLVAVSGDDRNVVDLPGLSFLAEPDEVARVVAEQLGTTAT